jgi:hypothetical protein
MVAGYNLLQALTYPMTKRARCTRYLLPAAVALTVIAAPCVTFAASEGSYLNWSHKAQAADNTPAPTEQVQTATGAYAVPASPYGQVGDPYGHSLRWPAKQAPTMATATPALASITPLPPQTFAPVPAPPMRAAPPVSISQPVPMSAPRPVTVVTVQSPDTYPADPGLADDPDLTPEAPVAATQPAPRAAQKPAVKPLPAVASAPPIRTETTPAPPAVAAALSSDGAYEVPANSKYAARIAAARAAALPIADAPKGKTATKSTATAPEPDVSLASQETDHVFIPGEQYTTPADEPRLYSLHRQYGMKPDPIQVTANPTGALLTVSPDDLAGDPNDDDQKTTDQKTDNTN